jgi:hypothetical protein
MTILTTDTGVQNITVKPRAIGNNLANKVFLIDEETNVTTSYNVSGYTEYDLYDNINASFSDLIEGRRYKMLICRDVITDVRYYGIAMCTDQVSTSLGFNDYRDYTINEGQYTENTTTNDFILL